MVGYSQGIVCNLSGWLLLYLDFYLLASRNIQLGDPLMRCMPVCLSCPPEKTIEHTALWEGCSYYGRLELLQHAGAWHVDTRLMG